MTNFKSPKRHLIKKSLGQSPRLSYENVNDILKVAPVTNRLQHVNGEVTMVDGRLGQILNLSLKAKWKAVFYSDTNVVTASTFYDSYRAFNLV